MRIIGNILRFFFSRFSLCAILEAKAAFFIYGLLLTLKAESIFL